MKLFSPKPYDTMAFSRASSLLYSASSGLLSIAVWLETNVAPKAFMTRQYSDKDIEQIKIIHNLIKVRGFKINAARKILNSNPTGKDKTTEVLDRLIGIRNELQLMKKQLDGTFE